MKNDVMKELIDLQSDAAKMRRKLALLVKNRQITHEQAAQADARLENFAHDIDIIRSEINR